MKKYYTPEIELEIISTSDICAASDEGDLESVFATSGAPEKVSWTSPLWK